MKKKRIELNQKLFLNKEKVASLSSHESMNVVGGYQTQQDTCRMQDVNTRTCPIKPQVVLSQPIPAACRPSNVGFCNFTGNAFCSPTIPNTIAAACIPDKGN